jgi:hypothetical protein
MPVYHVCQRRTGLCFHYRKHQLITKGGRLSNMASNFIYSNRDLKFIIGEWLDTDSLFSFDKYRDYYSHDDIDVILDQALKIVAEQVAPTNEDGGYDPGPF